MTKKQTRQFNMFGKVMAAMDQHLETWKDVPELARTNDRFVRYFKKLSELQEPAAESMNPLTDRYRENRRRLEGKIAPILGVVAVYAEDTKNRKLKKKAAVKAGGLKKLDDEALIALARVIANAARKQPKKGAREQPSISNYGLTTEMAATLKGVAEEFSETIATVKKAKKVRAKAREKEKVLTEKAVDLLKKRMDRLVKIFQSTHPAFVLDYMKARVVEKPEKKKAAEPSSGAEQGSDTGKGRTPKAGGTDPGANAGDGKTATKGAAGKGKTSGATKSGGTGKTGRATKTAGTGTSGSARRTGGAAKTGTTRRTGSTAKTGTTRQTGGTAKTGTTRRTGGTTKSGGAEKP